MNNDSPFQLPFSLFAKCTSLWFLRLVLYLIVCICICVGVCGWVHAYRFPQNCGVLYPLELELQAILNHQERVLRNELQSSAKAVPALKHQGSSLVPTLS